MQKLSTATNSYLSILYVVLVLIASDAIAAAQKAGNWLDEPISVSFQNEPLNKVLKQISEQTGVSIAYDQELANEKVTGNYKNVKTSDAITRLFKSKNISIQINNEKKIIIVKTFGAKNFIWAEAFDESARDESDLNYITIADLEKMHIQQYKSYKEHTADDNAILEDEGITRGQLRSMQEQQYVAYKKDISNDDEIPEDEVLTRGQLRNMHGQQYAVYKKDISNDDEIPKDEVLTRGQLRNIHKQQYVAYKKDISNDNKILEDGMLTRGQLRNIHEQQYNEYMRKRSY